MKKFVASIVVLLCIATFAEANAVSRLGIRGGGGYVARQRVVVQRIRVAPILAVRAVPILAVRAVAVRQVFAVQRVVAVQQVVAVPVVASIVQPVQALSFVQPIALGYSAPLVSRPEKVTEKLDPATGRVVERIIER